MKDLFQLSLLAELTPSPQDMLPADIIKIVLS